jgi:hypothetical protein
MGDVESTAQSRLKGFRTKEVDGTTLSLMLKAPEAWAAVGTSSRVKRLKNLVF